jgi:hypothetical protein
MYQPYPSGSQLPGQPARPVAPPSVQMAVKLMYAGAGLQAIGIVLTLATIGSLKSAILKQHPGYTTSQLHTAQRSVIVAAIVFGLIAVGLWIWMARANGAGKKWARTLATVFFGLATLDLLATVIQAHAVVALAFALLVWLAGLGAIILLWRSESSQYIAAASAPPAS